MQELPFISKSSSLIIKGVASIFIMMSHIIVGFPFWVKKLFPGNLWVCVFFFYSAYGLVFSVKNKNKYIEGFLSRKFFHIYLPFFVAESSYTILIFFISCKMSPVDLVLCCLGIKLSNGSLWYVIEIIVIYLFFYLWVRLFKLKHKWIWIVSYVVFVLLSVAFDIDTCWYISTSGFLLGLYFENILVWLSKLRFSYLLLGKLISCFFVLLYLTNIWIEYNKESILGIKSTQIQTFNDIVLAVIFIPLLFFLCKRITRAPRALLYLGRISYEIYLWHLFVYAVVISFFNIPIVFVLITVLFTLGLSSVMYYIKSHILERKRIKKAL